MLLSMTGFGEARLQRDDYSLHVEIRSVNNRHFKLTCRLPEGYMAAESRLDALARKYIRRGTLQLTLHVDRQFCEDDFQVNRQAIRAYYKQILELHNELSESSPISIDSMLLLPGVVEENAQPTIDLDRMWPAIEEVTKQALDRLAEMRAVEGRAMADDMHANRKMKAKHYSESPNDLHKLSRLIRIVCGID